ncbi:MAG TPA: PhoU domain-containing protein [candidate division Zixibacteria bacterium]|nr:PhoU domain-containing protein [candidate division Zixibacteria bacterium]
MFDKLKEMFSYENLFDQAYETTITMLEFDHKMFLDSVQALRESDTSELPYDFKEADRKINKFEREVRRNILTHIAISRPQDMVPGLVLVTIVIDVERIGDFCKNISEIATARKERLGAGEYEERLFEIERSIKEHFPAVIELLKTNDRDKASVFVAKEPIIAKKAESILIDMISAARTECCSPDLVRLTLYVRYLKRINAHLTNIASSVVNPFPRIGFRQKQTTD